MRITIYESAEDALANSERNAGSFYICDFRLPGMNGIQMLETVQHAQLPPVKAVVLTGETSPELIGLTRTSRWTVLHKPVDLSKLVSVIEEADENLR